MSKDDGLRAEWMEWLGGRSVDVEAKGTRLAGRGAAVMSRKVVRLLRPAVARRYICMPLCVC